MSSPIIIIIIIIYEKSRLFPPLDLHGILQGVLFISPELQGTRFKNIHVSIFISYNTQTNTVKLHFVTVKSIDLFGNFCTRVVLRGRKQAEVFEQIDITHQYRIRSALTVFRLSSVVGLRAWCQAP
jgi:hypothetical protein